MSSSRRPSKALRSARAESTLLYTATYATELSGIGLSSRVVDMPCVMVDRATRPRHRRIGGSVAAYDRSRHITGSVSPDQSQVDGNTGPGGSQGRQTAPAMLMG